MTQVVITSGATWTVPADCIAATVELLGAGQGGNATNGGNGGDYAKKAIASLTPGASVNIQLGVHGAGVASGSQNAGTDTWFSSAATVLAKGGGSASTSVGDATFAGGLGDASGGGGGAAGLHAAGGAASGSSGGQGDGTFGGLGGASGATGAAGTEWGTVGAGGGGGAFVASAGSVVQVVQGSWTTTSGTGAMAFTSAVQAGDRVVVVASRSSGANTVTLTASDNNATAYTQEAYEIGASNSSVAVFLSAAQVANAAFTVSVTPSGTSGGGVRAYLLRGMPSIALDITANQNLNATASGAIASGATYDMGAYSASGRAIVFAGVNIYQANSPTAASTFSADTVLTDDASGLGHGAGGHSELFGHQLVSAAVSAQPFKIMISTSSTGKASAAWVLIPFTY